MIRDVIWGYEVDLDTRRYNQAFRRAIRLLYRKYNRKVVILIDEYDAPIINVLDDVEKALRVREIMREFYRVIKANDEYIRFAMLTGVSRFSRAGVFSALNNLNDITIDSEYATMLGITEEELERYFSDYIELLGKKEGMNYKEVLEKIRFWYNGFCFDGDNPGEDRRVYNPFSTLLLFQKRKFHNYWFESGTPKFLIDLIVKRGYDITELEELRGSLDVLESYEPDSLDVVALLFQTGYITLKDRIGDMRYILGYPNYEVKRSFLEHLLRYMTRGKKSRRYIDDMYSSLVEGNVDRFMELMKAIFASIPYDITDRVSDREQHYQSLMYLVLALLGVDVRGEVRTNRGRIDLVVEVGDVVWVIEAKIRGSSRDALRQIEDRGYVERYVGRGKKVKKIGIVFDVEERNVKEWEVEEV
jgi:hypothetical protein